MTKSPLQLPRCSRKVVIYCSSVSAARRRPPALIQPPSLAGSQGCAPGPSQRLPTQQLPGLETPGASPFLPRAQASQARTPCGYSGLGWSSCRVREDWLGKASGLWASGGAEVEAIANVAESAHSDVAAR